MTDVIPFPPREDDDGAVAAGNAESRRAIPHNLIEAAADILNGVLSGRKDKILREEDWTRIRRACNFIDGAKTVAREQGLPHEGKSR